MRYAFYSHGGAQNHGCEALVKTLSALIKSRDKDAFIKLYTFRKSEDVKADFPDVDEYEEFDYTKKPQQVSFKDKLKISLLSKKSQKAADEYYYSLSCKNPSLKENDVYISVGGDNYCYGDGHTARAINTELRRLGKKTVLWGCSVGEEDLTEDKIADISAFDLVTARESYTYEALKKSGVKNLVIYPDSAFTLDIDKTFNEKYPVKKNTLGFNISNLISGYRDNTGKMSINDIAVSFLKHILDTTEMNILLIPHVTRDGKADCDALKEIYEKLDSERVGLVSGEYTASQYKSIISRCEMFIGARTHATIAAYSTCVPTLVIGYSIKSKGIAKDIFGTDDGLVLPVSEIDTPQKLIDAFTDFSRKKDEYKRHLCEFMPQYIERAENSIDELFKIL